MLQNKELIIVNLHLELSIQLWGPQNKKDMQLLEWVEESHKDNPGALL